MDSLTVATQRRKPAIPHLDEIKKMIDEMIGVDQWDRYKIKNSPKRFEKRLNELFLDKLGLMPYMIYLANNQSLPKKFYRLRKVSTSFNETLISEYSYPPNHVIKSVQRANLPYHPVFYCSDNPATAILETIKDEYKPGESLTYFMSEWKFREKQQIKYCPFIFDNIADNNPYKPMSDINKLKLAEKMKLHTEDEVAAMIEIFKFLSNLFLYENTYVVSSFLAHSNLYAPHNYRPDVFIYPSVQTKHQTVNFAIHPNAVTEKMVLSRVFKLVLNDYNTATGRFTTSVLSIGHNKGGIIYWTDVTADTKKGAAAIEEINELFGKPSTSKTKKSKS